MNQILLNGLVLGVYYALIALSVSVIYTPTRFFHFAHGAVFTSAAYCCLACRSALGLPFWLAALLGVAAAGLLGMGLEFGVYRQLRKSRSNALVMLLASLGLYVVLQNAISLTFGDDTKSLSGQEVAEGIQFLGGKITPIQLWILFGSAASIVLVLALFKFTGFGKTMRAVASDSNLARIQGIKVDSVILAAFALGSVLVGLAAVLHAGDVGVTPTMGLNAMIGGAVAMILGGVGNHFGAVVGGILLGFAQQLVAWEFGNQWQDTTVFLILIVFLVLRPQGLFGTVFKKAAA